MSAIRKAWLWLLGLPVAYLSSVVIGSLIFSLVLGLQEGTKLPATYLPLLLGVIAVLFAIPTYFAFRYGHKAREDGAQRPLLPAAIALLVSIAVIAVNLISYLQF